MAITSDDLTDRQWRTLCGIVDSHRAGRPPRKPGPTSAPRCRVLFRLGLVTDPRLPVPTADGIALVDDSTDE